MFKWGGGVLRGSTLPYLALTMIDVAICLELPTRVEHPPKWCIVGGVIYDDGPLWCLAGAYCAGRVWHGRPRSEQDRDVQAAWPEQCLMGLFLKRAKQQGSTCWGAMDTIVQCGTVGGKGELWLTLVIRCGWVWRWWSITSAIWVWVFWDGEGIGWDVELEKGLMGDRDRNEDNWSSHLFVKRGPSYCLFLILPPVWGVGGGSEGGQGL